MSFLHQVHLGSPFQTGLTTSESFQIKINQVYHIQMMSVTHRSPSMCYVLLQGDMIFKIYSKSAFFKFCSVPHPKTEKTCNQSLFFYCRKQTFSWYCSAFETIINPIISMLQVGYRNQNTDENLVLVCDIWNESNIDLAAVFNKVQMSCGYHLQ